ncbi:Apolipoprotein D-like 11 [Homarus americanus]|uniref:Apolipoprotein D-like 11 n=1 Tax=Homarus americanus TaxID=6706 RepID=A0A8J5MLK7_HOMAM|nr:Apolipoprotein D-like 11 [Homarus americanus]
MVSQIVMVVGLVFCLASTQAQVFFRGRCPKTPIIKDFDWHRYLGRWFEQERYFVAYQTVGRCWSGTYIKNKHTGKISVRLDFWDVVFNKPKVITVNVIRKKPYEQPNRLTYTIPNVPVFEDNYEVLATDYDNWTLEYAWIAWILTRKPHPSYSVINQAKETLTYLGIDVSYLKKQDTSCYQSYKG